MAEFLDFDIRANFESGFDLDAAASIPLQGVTAIKGPSGSGKTSLLRALAGLGSIDDGRVRFGSEIWHGKRNLATEARRIGFVFQSPSLFPHLTVADNIGYGAKRRRVSSFVDIIDALGLASLLTRDVTSLSGGEKRRVAVARALASDPKVLFLDEPLVGLDQDSKRDVLNHIARAIVSSEIPAIYVTHAADEISTVADRVLGLENGRVTGWLPAPNRLLGRVANLGSEGMTVKLEGELGKIGAEITLPVAAKLGERVGIAIPEGGYLISKEHPGRSNALAVLPVEIADQDNKRFVTVSGQMLSIPAPKNVQVGERCFLSILEALARPESFESQ